jgi:hypothetical protein
MDVNLKQANRRCISYRKAVLKYGCDWKQIAEALKCKSVNYAKERGLIALKKLKQKNYDPELLEALLAGHQTGPNTLNKS